MKFITLILLFIAIFIFIKNYRNKIFRLKLNGLDISTILLLISISISIILFIYSIYWLAILNIVLVFELSHFFFTLDKKIGQKCDALINEKKNFIIKREEYYKNLLKEYEVDKNKSLNKYNYDINILNNLLDKSRDKENIYKKSINILENKNKVYKVNIKTINKRLNNLENEKNDLLNINIENEKKYKELLSRYEELKNEIYISKNKLNRNELEDNYSKIKGAFKGMSFGVIGGSEFITKDKMLEIIKIHCNGKLLGHHNGIEDDDNILISISKADIIIIFTSFLKHSSVNLLKSHLANYNNLKNKPRLIYINGSTGNLKLELFNLYISHKN